MAVAKIKGPAKWDYASCVDFLHNKCEKKIAPNTWLKWVDPGKIVVQYHSTNIVTFLDNGMTNVNTGGWATRSTMGRMNQVIPYIRAYQIKGTAYLSDSTGLAFYLGDAGNHGELTLNHQGEVIESNPCLGESLGTFLGKEIKSRKDLEKAVRGLTGTEFGRVWKKFRWYGDKRFIARHCDKSNLLLILGSGAVKDIVSERLKE